jgi:hypothetical protein
MAGVLLRLREDVPEPLEPVPSQEMGMPEGAPVPVPLLPSQELSEEQHEDPRSSEAPRRWGFDPLIEFKGVLINLTGFCESG